MANTFIDINESVGAGSGVSDAIDLNFTPDGDIAATNVQDAIVEVRDDTDVKLTAKQDLSEKGQPNGYAALDGSGRIPSSQLAVSALEYKGAWDANTNSPALASGVGTTGDTYCVSVAGTTNLDGITDWQVGDFLIFNGTTWEKLDNTDAVASVNGQQGVVVLDTDDIAEGVTNLYYTSARFDSDFAGKDTDDLSEGAVNFYYTEARFDTSFGGKDTDDLSEGATNLYYTEARVSANADVAANTAHRDGGANKHDASEIDVEGTLTNAPSAPTDLETVLSEFDTNLQTAFVTVVPTGSTQGDFETAVNAVDALGGGRVLLDSGTYNFGSTSSTFTGLNNVTIEGQGPSSRIEFNSANGQILVFNATSAASGTAANNYSIRDTSVFTSVAGDAASFLAGDYIIIRGTNSDTGEPDAEFNVVETTGNGGTGEIALQFRTTMTMTGVTLARIRDNEYNRVRNLRIVETGGNSDRAIFFQNSNFCRVDDVTFEGPGGFRLGCVVFHQGIHSEANDCRMSDMDQTTGVSFQDCLHFRADGNIMRGLNVSGFANINGIAMNNDSHDGIITNNKFYDLRVQSAIDFDDTPGGRHLVSNNTMIGIQGNAIRIEGYDLHVSDNLIKNTSSTAILVTSNNDRVQIVDNKIINPTTGVQISSGGQDYIVAGNSVFSSSIGIICLGISGVVEGNVVTNPSSDGINIGIGTGVTVSDNSISDGSNRGMHITDGTVECSISQNTIYNSGGVAIELRGNANGAIERCVVSNNVISRAAAAAGNGILVTGGIDNIICQNSIRDYTTAAIRLEDQSSPVIVTDWNMVRLNNVRGLVITDASTGANNDIANNIT